MNGDWNQDMIDEASARLFPEENMPTFSKTTGMLALFAKIGEGFDYEYETDPNIQKQFGELLGAVAVGVIDIAGSFGTRIAFDPDESYSYTAKEAFAAALQCYAPLVKFASYLDNADRTFSGTLRERVCADINQCLSHLAKLAVLLGTDLQTEINVVMNDMERDLG